MFNIIFKSKVLSVPDFQKIIENMFTLADEFNEKGWTCEELDIVTVEYTTSPADLFEIFTTVENNIKKLYAALPSELLENCPYYKDYTWTIKPADMCAEVWRWIDFCNWAYEEVQA